MNVFTKSAHKINIASQKAAFQVKKYSPEILIGVGVAGLVGTAVLVYKSRPKVDAVVSEIEEKRSNEEPVNTFVEAGNLAKALGPAIVLGTSSIGCILLSHKIMRDRLLGVSAQLGVAAMEKEYFRNKYKEQYGEEALKEFERPVENQEVEMVDTETGEKTTEEKPVPVRLQLNGCWWEDSEYYVSDDDSYNQAYINAVVEKAKDKLFERGYLPINEFQDMLGVERSRRGAGLGWNTSVTFDVDVDKIDCYNHKTGMMETKTYIHWTEPKFIYDDIDYGSGRYSIYSD